jgi:PAS domain S-box-containing protein
LQCTELFLCTSRHNCSSLSSSSLYIFVFEEQEEERKQARVRESALGNRGSLEIILLCTGILSKEELARKSKRPTTRRRRSGMELGEEELTASVKRYYKESLKKSLGQYDFNFVLTDPRLPDNPIVYASEGFCSMSGYEHHEVIGRNCRFLQGPNTDRRTVLEIRDAVREERPCQVHILNYTKHGNPFWNLFYMAPVYSREDGTVVHFVGVQTPFSASATAAAALLASKKLNLMDAEKMKEARSECLQQIQGEAPVPEQQQKDVFHHRFWNKNADDGSRKLGTEESGRAQDGDEDSSRPRLNVEETQVGIHHLRAAGDEEEDHHKCVAKDEDKGRAACAVQTILCNLMENSRIGGGGRSVAETRCKDIAESAVAGVVCSSLMLSLTRIQQSFVL